MLQKFIILLVLISSLNVQAMISSHTKINEGDISLSSAQVRLVSVKEICPSKPGLVGCLALGQKVTLEFTVNGCMDRVGPVFHKFVRNGASTTLFVAAVNIANESSDRVLCVRMPSVTKTITVPYQGKIDVKILNHEGQELKTYHNGINYKNM